MLLFVQSSGIWPRFKESWKMNVNAGVIEVAISLGHLEVIWSVPVAVAL